MTINIKFSRKNVNIVDEYPNEILMLIEEEVHTNRKKIHMFVLLVFQQQYT